MTTTKGAPEVQRPLSVIASYCRRETQKFLAQRVNNPAFCFELFRRALIHPPDSERDAAWQAVYAQYHLQHQRAPAAPPAA